MRRRARWGGRKGGRESELREGLEVSFGIESSLFCLPGRGTKEAVVAAALDMGFKTKYMSSEGLCRLATFFFDYDEKPINGKPVGPAAALRSLHEQDPIIHIPHEYILAARVSLLMRGTSQLMAQKRTHIALTWQREAENAVRSLTNSSLT